MAKDISMIDLFAGCGGMTAGFAANGYKPVMAVESNLHAAATYAANFGESHVYLGDIAQVHADAIPEADVIVGGPPCQGFSSLGSKTQNDPRNQLWEEYVRFVLHSRPKVFVIENVGQFLKANEFTLLEAETRRGGALEGYKLTHGELLAADFGVPQRRKRAFVIGSRIGKIPLPSPTYGKHSPKAWRTVRHAFGRKKLADKPRVTDLPAATTTFFGETIPGIFRSEDLHIGRNPRDISLQRYAHIPPGGGRFDLPDELLPQCWKNKPSGTTDVMGRMRWDEPSLTIRTEFYKPEKGQYLHPQWEPGPDGHRVDRPITHREAALLQTFPDSFRWCGTKIEIAKQIGNAVPPLLAEAIATHLKPYVISSQ
ncbi:DNA cytosine methyltransferase [Streptomyces sp. NPDC001262]|uniref:DNA cytosine methyltransferase n=1 Tax=unclassified Streptomyces TaxID=2593676 RepID=UPI0036CCEDC3